jgi:hypothetical protein
VKIAAWVVCAADLSYTINQGRGGRKRLASLASRALVGNFSGETPRTPSHRLTKAGNRRLKNVLLAAARSAVVQGANPNADKYGHWTQQEGMHPATARRNVARSLASTLWSL